MAFWGGITTIFLSVWMVWGVISILINMYLRENCNPSIFPNKLYL